MFLAGQKFLETFLAFTLYLQLIFDNTLFLLFVWANVGEAKIWESCSEKLLGINIDRELSFNYHVSNLCIKAGRKISALARISRLCHLINGGF